MLKVIEDYEETEIKEITKEDLIKENLILREKIKILEEKVKDLDYRLFEIEEKFL